MFINVSRIEVIDDYGDRCLIWFQDRVLEINNVDLIESTVCDLYKALKVKMSNAK